MGRILQNTLALTQRRKLIAERYLAGKTQSCIAEDVGVHQATVSRDLGAIRDVWRASAVRDFEAQRCFALAQLDETKREAWEAYERSKEVAVTTKRHTDRHGNERVVTITETRYGDPRLLGIIIKCIAEQCKLEGLYQHGHS